MKIILTLEEIRELVANKYGLPANFTLQISKPKKNKILDGVKHPNFGINELINHMNSCNDPATGQGLFDDMGNIRNNRKIEAIKSLREFYYKNPLLGQLGWFL